MKRFKAPDDIIQALEVNLEMQQYLEQLEQEGQRVLDLFTIKLNKL